MSFEEITHNSEQRMPPTMNRSASTLNQCLAEEMKFVKTLQKSRGDFNSLVKEQMKRRFQQKCYGVAT